MKRPYDILVYGATGFTGRLTSLYLANNAPAQLNWAIAGRNQQKLERLKAELVAANRDCQRVAILTADSSIPTTLPPITQQAQVVLSTAGPYLKFGEPLVWACVETATNYVDITGEPQFVNAVYDRYDATARARNIRIINSCGFDSIPHDFGVYYLIQQFAADAAVTVEGFVSGAGTFSGGTWHSAIEAMGHINLRASPPIPGVSRNGARVIRLLRPRVRYEQAINGWAVPLPTIDPQVVLRSASALPEYGAEFRYGHYARIGSLPKLVVGAAGVGAVVGLAQFKPTRSMLLKIRQPGDGPDAETRAKSKFRVTFIGRAGAQRQVAEVSGGDPGYDETAKMVSEAALSLIYDELPAVAGVLTPVVALRDPLLQRLQRAGIQFKLL